MNRRSRFLTVYVIGGILFTTGFVHAAENPVTQPRQVRSEQFHPGYFVYQSGSSPIQTRLLENGDLIGVKRNYDWKNLEVAKGVYDFSAIEIDLKILQAAGKRLWVEIIYTQFHGTDKPPKTPEYMWTDPSYGGDSRYYGNYERDVGVGGWYPLFWNTQVKQRMHALFTALGQRFNGEPFFEGLNVGESAARPGPGWTCEGYEQALKELGLATKSAFPDKIVFAHINFACFDLSAFAAWLDQQGIGMGTPDIYISDEKLVGETYPLFLKYRESVPAGPDVQWFNYDRNSISVAEILDFAIEHTNPWYMFWQVREPYFTDEVLPAIRAKKLPAAELYYSGETQTADTRPLPPTIMQIN